MDPRRSRALYWLLALPASGLLLYFSLRGVAWAQVGLLLSTVRPGWAIAAWALGGLAYFLRALRWRVLLTAQGEVRVSTAFWTNSAGYFGNSFLPARAGELVRAFTVSAASGLSRTYALTTGISERIADAIALVAIGSVVLASGEFHPPWLGRAAAPFAVAGAFGILALLLLPHLDALTRRLIAWLPFPAPVKEKCLSLLAQVVLGAGSFRDPSRLGKFVVFTALIWFVDATGSTFVARSLGLSLSLPAAFLLIAALGLSSAVPSTPGYVGVYQFVAVTVLVPFGFSRTNAIAYILFGQAQQYVLVATLGGLGFWQYRKLGRTVNSYPAPTLATPSP